MKVFITSRESKCDECKEDLGRKAWITPAEEKGALCLSCADLVDILAALEHKVRLNHGGSCI